MSFNNIIWCAGNFKRLDDAIGLLDELKLAKLRPNIYTYGALMHGCAKTQNYKQALAWLEQMEKERIRPNNVVYTSAMEACAESGQYKEALKVMEAMKRAGIRPDLTMINAAIKACCLSGAMEEAEELAESLRELDSMDLFTYHTLMMGNTKLARHQHVLDLYEEAIMSTASVDGGIYSLAMLAALNSKFFGQVPRIAERARRQGVQLTEASYTILMQAYGEMGDSELAVACLNSMTHEGLRPNVISFAAAMSACKNEPRRVLDLLGRMEREGLKPNTVVLTTAINALARAAGSEFTNTALEMLRDMESNGPEPNIFTYNTVTRAFAEAGQLEEALKVLLSIKNRGLRPDRFTFTTLLVACGRSKTNSSEQVKEVMTLMKEAGIVPDEIAFGAAIDAHRRGGNAVLAVDVLHEMIRNGIEPSPAHYNLVLRTLKVGKMAPMMFRMINALGARDNAKINGNSYELVIEALVDEGLWRESMVLVAEMDKRDYTLRLELCVRLVEVLEKARQYRVVLALYRKMVTKGYDFYENEILNDVFKRLVSVASIARKEDLTVDGELVVPDFAVQSQSAKGE
jgi:pentatricopeptide repeat protein